VVVGVIWSGALYLLQGMPLKNASSDMLLSFAVISATFILLKYSKVHAPLIVLGCLLLGWIF
jgi:chromate transporter